MYVDAAPADNPKDHSTLLEVAARTPTMSRISSLNAASSYNLSSILAQARENAESPDAGSGAPSDSPHDFLVSELEDQGYTGAALDELLDKIQAAVQGLQSAKGAPPKLSDLHDAINKVLKDAGVDTDKIDDDFAARAGARNGGKSDAGGGQLDELLAALGIDPKQFESALVAALQNPNSDGTIDLSKLFATAKPGAQLNLQA
jgi:hypothetical protein